MAGRLIGPTECSPTDQGCGVWYERILLWMFKFHTGVILGVTPNDTEEHEHHQLTPRI